MNLKDYLILNEAVLPNDDELIALFALYNQGNRINIDRKLEKDLVRHGYVKDTNITDKGIKLLKSKEAKARIKRIGTL